MTPPSLGTRIRRARERRQLSQEELAAAVGASSRAVGDWENDRRRPRNRLTVLEDVLGVNLGDEPGPQHLIPKSVLRAIENADGLTPEERQAVIENVERTLATERGEAAASAPAPAARPVRRRPASL